MTNPKVRVRYNSLVRRILRNGKVRGVVVEDRKAGEVDGVFIFIGLEPNSELTLGQLAVDECGYVLVNDRMETSIPGVFAAGDVRRGAARQTVTVPGACPQLGAPLTRPEIGPGSKNPSRAGRVV